MEETKPFELRGRGIARTIASILLALSAAVVGLMELAWHVEILLKLLPG